MSAKLFKTLANGACTVRSIASGTVRVYWQDGHKLHHLDIDPFHSVDLTKFASIKQLRKSASLKRAVSKGWLRVQ